MKNYPLMCFTFLLVISLSLVGNTQAQINNQEWPMFRHDSSHSGLNP
jgi:hypothetical protein